MSRGKLRRLTLATTVAVIVGLGTGIAGCKSSGSAAGHADDGLPVPGAGVGDDVPQRPADGLPVGTAAEQEAARIRTAHPEVVKSDSALNAGCEVYFWYKVLTAEDEEAVISELSTKVDKTTAQKLVRFASDLQNSDSLAAAAEATASTLICGPRP